MGATAATAARSEGTGTGGKTGGRPIDEHWDDGTTMDEATMASDGPPTGATFEGAEELTVEEGRPAQARLVVIAGNDTGREFVLTPGKVMTIGRAIENDVVLTDIAVSRKHLDVVWEGAWILKDRGSGNGTLVNDRIEDGQCRLQHGDRIEIGHTVFRFDHTGATGAQPALGWGTQNDDEASTVAGRQPPRPTVKGPPPVNVPAAGRRGSSSPPPMPAGGARATLPPPARARTPSQSGANSGALSSRLALPAAEDTLAPGMKHEPAFLSAAGLAGASDSLQVRADGRHEMRTMTATSHVDPLPYGSGSLPPVHAYARQPMPTKRIVGIGAGIFAAFTLIGVIAMVAGGDDAPQAAPTSAKSVSPPPEPEPEPVKVAASDQAVEPEPEPQIDPEPEPEPEPEPQPEPEPVKVEPKIEVPVPVPKVEPEVKKVEPKVEPEIKKVEPKEKGITKPDPRKKPDKKKEPERIEREPKKEKPAPATSLAAAKKKAQSLYASKDFKGAAEAARSAASSASDDDAVALKKLAGEYDTLNSAMNAGNAAAASKPTDALSAYKKALAADKRLGGTHAPMIREKLASVAPKAAAGFMAKGNYEAAKQAADTAVNFGAGSSATVTQVRQSLERKAGEFYANGQKLMASKPEEAKALLRRVQKIVPPDSPWYIKAYKALNTRSTKTRDDDE